MIRNATLDDVEAITAIYNDAILEGGFSGYVQPLSVKNLSNLTPHPWYSAYYYSHPTPTERIGALRQGGA